MLFAAALSLPLITSECGCNFKKADLVKTGEAALWLALTLVCMHCILLCDVSTIHIVHFLIYDLDYKLVDIIFPFLLILLLSLIHYSVE